MILDGLLDVFELFFRRRPSLDALMWHTENKAAGESFTVPQGKIYEVYALVPSTDLILDSSDSEIAYNGSATEKWMPAYLNIVSDWVFDKIDPATGVVTYAGGAPVQSAYDVGSCMASQGWLFSEKQSIHTLTGAAFKVLWRDVTHRQ